MKAKGVFFVLMVAAGLVGLTGCSSFHKEWKASMKGPAPTDSINGPWIGDWKSDANGHHGSLKCVVTKTSDTTYRAHYRAHFFKIFWYTYAATLNGNETNGVVMMRGEADLGKAGGVYQYEGTATPTEFRSSYSSKHDHGNYQMMRPWRW
jgi:hypothetical protein